MKSLVAFLITAGSSMGAVITGANTVGLTIFTTGDGLVTLTPIGNNPNNTTRLNLASAFIGVDSGLASGGVTLDSGRNGINDKDGKPATTSDQEALDIDFMPTVGLSEIAFAFTRADGPAATDGIQISGFTADPGVSGLLLPTAGGFRDIRWDSGTGSIFAELAGTEFNATVRVLSFSNLSASLGATLRITSNDSDQTAPQVAISSITYVPEPAAALLGGFGLLGLLRRRR